MRDLGDVYKLVRMDHGEPILCGSPTHHPRHRFLVGERENRSGRIPPNGIMRDSAMFALLFDLLAR